jgi:hypothetical protein
MMPEGARELRRERRRYWRGMPTGRHPRTVQTTYGRHQKARDRAEAFSAFCAERRELGEGRATA